MMLSAVESTGLTFASCSWLLLTLKIVVNLLSENQLLSAEDKDASRLERHKDHDMYFLINSSYLRDLVILPDSANFRSDSRRNFGFRK